jgi:hypothetical protein
MPSPFQKYQSEQVQQIAPGFVEGFGRAGASIGQGLASAGASIAGGMEKADAKATEEAKQKGALSVYLSKDKAKIEAAVKYGSLIKNPDGTVTVNPNSPNKDLMDQSAIDFYNQSKGNIDNLTGKDLARFTAAFESKKKIDALEREAETSKVELDLKRAQTAKFNADAAATTAEVGNLNTIYNAAGFGNPAPGAAGSTIPTVPGSPVAPGAVARPSLNAYTGTGTGFSSTGTATDTAFFESLARFDQNKNRGVQPVAPAAEPFNIADAASSIGMTENDLVASAQGMGVTPAEYVKGYLGETSSAPAAQPAAAPAAPAAPAVSSALTAGTKPTTVATGQPAQATTQTAATQPAAAPAEKVEIQPVRETAEVVQARINTLNEERTRLVAKSQEEYAAKKTTIDAKKANVVVTKRTSQAANMLISYAESELQEIKDRYKVEIDAVDSQIKAEQGKLDIAKTVAGSNATAKAEVAAGKKATREETEQQRSDALAYPRIGPFVHLGSEIIRKGREPSKYGIRGLTAQAQNEVNTLAEGWIKSTDFIIGMSNTLEDRELTGQDYTARMRLFTKDMENWANGELQQIFGVATFRRLIVSGGNFSDSDRVFVMRAVAYINTLDPIDDKEVFEASTNALARFVDNMYRKSMSGYDMKFNTQGLLDQANQLEADGFPNEAAQQREVANNSQRFLDKYGIQDKGGRMTFDATAVEEARSVLWSTLDKAGQLKDADKEVKDGEVVFRLKDSAPKSK